MQLKRTYNQQEFGQLHAGTQSELERTASENSRLHARVWALEEDRDALMVFRDTLLVSLSYFRSVFCIFHEPACSALTLDWALQDAHPVSGRV